MQLYYIPLQFNYIYGGADLAIGRVGGCPSLPVGNGDDSIRRVRGSWTNLKDILPEAESQLVTPRPYCVKGRFGKSGYTPHIPLGTAAAAPLTSYPLSARVQYKIIKREGRRRRLLRRGKRFVCIINNKRRGSPPGYRAPDCKQWTAETAL